MSERYDAARQIYDRLLVNVARLVALDVTGVPISKENIQQFLELYYGPMLEFEDQDISETMDRI